jgi:hypothetical protein
MGNAYLFWSVLFVNAMYNDVSMPCIMMTDRSFMVDHSAKAKITTCPLDLPAIGNFQLPVYDTRNRDVLPGFTKYAKPVQLIYWIFFFRYNSQIIWDT